MGFYEGVMDATIALCGVVLKPVEVVMDCTHIGDIKRTREDTMSAWKVIATTKEARRKLKEDPALIEVADGVFRRDFLGDDAHFMKDGKHYYWNEHNNVLYNEPIKYAKMPGVEVR